MSTLQRAGRPLTRLTDLTRLTHLTDRALGPYQTAVIRIGLSFTWLCFLLREWPNRHRLYGPDGPWSWSLARQLITDNGAFTALLWNRSDWWFESCYLLAMASALLLMLGWHTRAMSVLSMIGVVSLQNRTVFVGDGGDNVLHLMALYLVLTRCGRVWSLDARRRRRATSGAGGLVLWICCGLALALVQTCTEARLHWTDHGPLPGLGWAAALWGLWLVHALWWLACEYAPGEPRSVLDALANLIHNAALLVIMAEVCLIYATAGWYKIQGTLWQDGTALYYPLHLDYFTPWPWLSHLLAGSGLMVLILSYATVAMQVAFPFTLANRRLKNALLVVMMAEHLGIAVLLGLPFFSLAMLAADAVFLPTSFLRWAGDAVSRRFREVRARVPAQRGGPPVAGERAGLTGGGGPGR
ncbi:HTTM domain-containing protein [Streptomyces orinoci]|uniref:HTTM domain-containing protein n=1 Tax=Streptomyces orinoci TaxID=67339 RepID=A0ABV3K3W4_STRON|nr:HTTM domain-containing protein [Streptomyces orinoci]